MQPATCGLTFQTSFRWTREKFQSDPQWGDHILFYEYFHGDNGAGLAPAIRPAGPGWWPRPSSSTGFWIPSVHWKLVSRPGSRRKPEPLGKESRT